MVARTGGNTARQSAAVPDRHGGLRRRASSQPQAATARPRCPADAGEVRAPVFEGAEERLPRCGGDHRSGAAPDDEVRRNQDCRAVRFAGAAPRARAVGQPAHRHHQSDPTGDRTILGSISKQGNRYLRALFVQAAWVVLVKVGPKHWERYGLRSWIEAAKKRLHHNVLAIALANKLARIAWSILAHGRTFEASKLQAA